MNKVFMSLLFGTFLLTATSFAQTPAPAAAPAPADAPAAAPAEAVKPAHHMHHSELHKVLHKLKAAKQDLEKVTHDYDGHKAKAIEAIDTAITEIQAALDLDKK